LPTAGWVAPPVSYALTDPLPFDILTIPPMFNKVMAVADIKLFRTANNQVNALIGATDTIEKSVQVLFEKSLETLIGVRLLASEFITTHGGRIDSLGLDENGCPVILEYKRTTNENVINQGLFYLGWLMDHKKDF
jgi:RecB family endonuclease NucS